MIQSLLQYGIIAWGVNQKLSLQKSYSNYYEYWTLKNYKKASDVKKHLEIPFTNTIKASNIFNQVGLRTLEIIPEEIRECSNYLQFKYKLKNWFYDSL
ncbi:Reverse transcriptase domain-containing protein [Aphis craccivora]|uniref:Reverse transcriptase domain-containing protein n=1 Tax=Aphis craccivora TaxID=307492 RepID=A0A6G0ZC31_APHCR|nr:Reverse transcriptase domain-containing protein [Aphis craccivora]